MRALVAVVILGTLGGLTVSASVHSDTLLIKRATQAEAGAMPRRGLIKSQVEAQYGAPVTKHAAVGKPPISRWDYPAFSVYFEHNHVIDAVAKRASSTEMGVKPAPNQ